MVFFNEVCVCVCATRPCKDCIWSKEETSWIRIIKANPDGQLKKVSSSSLVPVSQRLPSSHHTALSWESAVLGGRTLGGRSSSPTIHCWKKMFEKKKKLLFGNSFWNLLVEKCHQPPHGSDRRTSLRRQEVCWAEGFSWDIPFSPSMCRWFTWVSLGQRDNGVEIVGYFVMLNLCDLCCFYEQTSCWLHRRGHEWHMVGEPSPTRECSEADPENPLRNPPSCLPLWFLEAKIVGVPQL